MAIVYLTNHEGIARLCGVIFLEVVMKFLLTPTALIFALIASASVHAETYRIDAWPRDLDKVPCDAFKKNADGSWTQTGTIVGGGMTMTGNTFKDTGETKMLEQRCGASQ